MKATDQLKRLAYEKAFDYFLSDPVNNATKIMNALDKVAPDNLFPSQRKAFRTAIDEQNNWFQLIMKIVDLNPAVRDDLIKAFVIDGNLMAWPEQEKMRDKHQCNIPWAILLDPTSACNLHCTGCWAAEYGHKLNLTFEEIDSIIEPGQGAGHPRVHLHRRRAPRAQGRPHRAVREAPRLPPSCPSRTPPSSTRTSARRWCA